MSPSVRRHRTVRELLQRLRQDRRGSAAVEFAMLAPLFFAMLFAIIETAIVFFAGQVLETATQDTARLIMTGQSQATASEDVAFKTALCNRLQLLFDCTQLRINVKSYSNFSTIAINDATDDVNTFQKNTAQGSIVVVRVFYSWPMFVTGLGYKITTAGISGNKRRLSATATFRNEPF